MKSRTLLISVAVAAVCVSFEASAHSPMDKGHGGDLAQLVDQSNLVFIGNVERVTYGYAKGSAENEGPIPYTIVTYRIDKVLRGQAPGKEITMRFLGGPDGRGRFLSVTGVPVIQEGDQDLLFVGNTEDPSCPLVFCELGRYRILNDQVFDTYGSAVRAVIKTKVVSRGTPPKEFRTVRFPTPKFDELIRNPEVAEALKAQNLSPDEARRRYEEGAPKYVEFSEEFPIPEKLEDAGKGAPAPAQAEQVAPMPLSRFVAMTTELATASKRAPAAVRSIDPNAEIVAAKLKITVPRQLTAPILRAPTNAVEKNEYDALVKNNFNPVIRK